MYIWSHSEDSYLCESKARSQVGGIAFLSNISRFPILQDNPPPAPNHAILVICKILDAVMNSAQEQEAETREGFVTARELAPVRITLIELGHAQGPTPLRFDNQCSKGILTDKIK